jgi:hypothetical protein
MSSTEELKRAIASYGWLLEMETRGQNFYVQAKRFRPRLGCGKGCKPLLTAVTPIFMNPTERLQSGAVTLDMMLQQVLDAVTAQEAVDVHTP